MAREKLDRQVRSGIADQISQRLFSAMPFMVEAQPELGESLKVMLLTPEGVSESQGKLGERLVDTGQWHHQIFSANRANAYARSLPLAEGEHSPHEVVEVARSTLPGAVEDSIANLADDLPDEADARLILAPSYQIAAVWLSGDDLDDVIVSAAPDTMQHLSAGQRLSADDFLTRLQKTEPIPGLGPPPDADRDRS